MLSLECPCGRARLGCTYHDPALQLAAQPALDSTEVPGCGKSALVAGVFFPRLKSVSVRHDTCLVTLETDDPTDQQRLIAMYNADAVCNFPLMALIIGHTLTTSAAHFAGVFRQSDGSLQVTLRWWP